MRITPVGGFRAQYATDVLDRSGGNIARLSYLGKITKDKLTVYPSVGFEYHDADHNQYYYGVSDTESARTRPRTAAPCTRRSRCRCRT